MIDLNLNELRLSRHQKKSSLMLVLVCAFCIPISLLEITIVITNFSFNYIFEIFENIVLQDSYKLLDSFWRSKWVDNRLSTGLYWTTSWTLKGHHITDHHMLTFQASRHHPHFIFFFAFLKILAFHLEMSASSILQWLQMSTVVVY